MTVNSLTKMLNITGYVNLEIIEDSESPHVKVIINGGKLSKPNIYTLIELWGEIPSMVILKLQRNIHFLGFTIVLWGVSVVDKVLKKKKLVNTWMEAKIGENLKH